MASIDGEFDFDDCEQSWNKFSNAYCSVLVLRLAYDLGDSAKYPPSSPTSRFN